MKIKYILLPLVITVMIVGLYSCMAMNVDIDGTYELTDKVDSLYYVQQITLERQPNNTFTGYLYFGNSDIGYDDARNKKEKTTKISGDIIDSEYTIYLEILFENLTSDAKTYSSFEVIDYGNTLISTRMGDGKEFTYTKIKN